MLLSLALSPSLALRILEPSEALLKNRRECSRTCPGISLSISFNLTIDCLLAEGTYIRYSFASTLLYYYYYYYYYYFFFVSSFSPLILRPLAPYLSLACSACLGWPFTNREREREREREGRVSYRRTTYRFLFSLLFPGCRNTCLQDFHGSSVRSPWGEVKKFNV